jgi:hypothetical protein
MLKAFAWILVIAGLALGPVYWIYITHFTGSVAANLPLQSRPDDSLVSPVFRLDPAMNPVGLIFKTQGSFSPNMLENQPPKNVYQAILHRGQEAAEPIKFQLAVKSTADSNPSFQEHLVLLHVPAAAEYRLEILPLAEPEIALQHPGLVVRQGVQVPDARLAAAGIIGLGVGILMLLM